MDAELCVAFSIKCTSLPFNPNQHHVPYPAPQSVNLFKEAWPDVKSNVPHVEGMGSLSPLYNPHRCGVPYVRFCLT